MVTTNKNALLIALLLETIPSVALDTRKLESQPTKLLGFRFFRSGSKIKKGRVHKIAVIP